MCHVKSKQKLLYSHKFRVPSQKKKYCSFDSGFFEKKKSADVNYLFTKSQLLISPPLYYTTLDILFSSNHNIHKSSRGLCCDLTEKVYLQTHSSYIYWAFKLSLSILPFLSLLLRYTHSILNTKIIVGTFALGKPYFRYIRIIRSGCPVPSTSSYMIPTQMQHKQVYKRFLFIIII